MTTKTKSKSPKRMCAEATLPANLHASFDELVAEYEASAEIHVGKGWVNYNILADLVRAGWQKITRAGQQL
ncbi:MAG TPA: hypothetical protein VN930_09805 [Xanthobacteraceae bacterium]|nr:hypothetical protein [Xanthobacteraceae bacterium]